MKVRNYKSPVLFVSLLCIIFISGCSVGMQVIDVAEIDRDRILSAAEIYLLEEPETVTAYSCDRSAGGLHDYYSEGDYWWPDPEQPDGPYIRMDGNTNPDNFTAHRKVMRNMSIWVPTLVAAYKITGDEKYAQAIMGRVSGRGIGIIDTLHFAEVARAIQVLDEMGSLAG